jgi:anti-sigma factor RsiW
MSRFTLFPKNRRMMSCRRVGEVLQAYLDGEVDDITSGRVAHHLEDCRRCGMELGVYTEIKTSLSRGGSTVDDAAVARLREFSQRLADGTDPDDGTGADDGSGLGDSTEPDDRDG